MKYSKKEVLICESCLLYSECDYLNELDEGESSKDIQCNARIERGY